jgi:ATP-dependent Clp protease adapter protein ClpS
MSGNDTDLRTKTVPKVERPRLYKVILINDDLRRVTSLFLS